MSLKENILTLIKNPTSIIALIGLLIIIGVLIKTRKIKLNSRIIAIIGVSLGLATVLKVFRIYHLPQGGSITAGSMVPILLVAFFYGPEIGFLTGFLYGLITLSLDPYILHPVQVLFDYPLPFIALGLAGYFPERKVLGSVVAIFGRFLCHFISGWVFFGSFAPKGMSPFIYSFTVNGLFILVEGGVAIAIMSLLPVKNLRAILNRGNKNFAH
ncbi:MULTISPECIES: energy-coupled thiamine transporter ThiT [Clostridium]|jgi:thiamine transporter|uniref:Thiamine transporter ThiT n=2 Tax=Clostridium TaxID=1485 RepID=A0A151ALN0_9CLOT|nr:MULTISPECIES: energy-coupled thiamine transporter ThiT [Clostridium]KYH28307.1 thiamine transporter ThiT [Clostridium colicanis DSM 13634]PRR74313.1 Thiamine transporter ThiT [Clostridium thermopalmarium DSM 5974]PVZ22101.1 thiamine transporter [Clostridium thermopalmarium DSM 5974]